LRISLHQSSRHSTMMNLLLLSSFLVTFSHAFTTSPGGASRSLFSEKLGEQQHQHYDTYRHGRSSSSCVILSMGWGPDPIWSSGKVTSNEAACTSESCVSITVEVPSETAKEYKMPGQYVQFRLNEETKPLFLAISSAPSPDNASFEFLIKKTDNNDWVTGAAVDTKVELSQVLGGGFPIPNFEEEGEGDTKEVLLFAAGSGIAPIKAAMESGQLGDRSAKLYYGVRNPDELCFGSSFEEWEKKYGVEVVTVMSQPPSDYEGRSGYVQKALEDDKIANESTGVLMCGMKEMAEAVKDICTKAGVLEKRILTNF